MALIIAPWNYPVQLLIAPLIGAIAAGNCVVLKPSPYTKNVSRVLTEMIESCFDKDYIIIYQGDHMENQAILSNRFDYIFFTGGTEFGKYVAQCAANFLTPTTLELGGKSPCIVSKYADIDMSAKRIVWGKLLNAGQTCIAPDYIFAECSIKDKLIEKMIFYIESFFGKDQSLSDVYPRIISDKAIEDRKSVV